MDTDKYPMNVVIRLRTKLLQELDRIRDEMAFATRTSCMKWLIRYHQNRIDAPAALKEVKMWMENTKQHKFSNGEKRPIYLKILKALGED